jgi:signal transduction histidine kinase
MFDEGCIDGDRQRAMDVGSVPARTLADESSHSPPAVNPTAEWLDVAATAHRLNNLLVAICGLSEIMRDAEQEPSGKEDLTTILTQSRRASELVDRLLEGTKRQRQPLERVDINEALEKVLAHQGPALRRSEVQVHTRQCPEVPPVPGVAHHIEQVFENLLENASAALEQVSPPRNLFVDTRSEGERAVVCFRDEGPGIAPEVLPFVFQPYFTTRGGRRSGGLGLAVSKLIVESIGGEIDISSREGIGTTVLVRLPVAASPTEHASFRDRLCIRHPPLRYIYRKRTGGRGKCAPWR